jgi:hypothetical protein
MERVFENRVLRKIYRLERDEVRGEWRKLHNEDFHNLRSSSNIPCYKDDQIKEY